MNKTNLELKHHCTDFVGVRKVLSIIGAKKEVVKRQVDYFFGLPRKIGSDIYKNTERIARCFYVMRPAGFEPATVSLKGSCSTN